MQDKDILQLLRQPNTFEEGFCCLIDMYGERLYWHIRRIVVGHEDAQDAMQETSIRILNGIKSFNGDSTGLKSWLYRTATNEALMLLRKKKHFYESLDSLSTKLLETLQAENTSMLDTAEIELQKVVLQLPTTQRLVFNMRYYDELPYEDISQVTGKSIATLKTNYHYASERIKNKLKDILL